MLHRTHPTEATAPSRTWGRRDWLRGAGAVCAWPLLAANARGQETPAGLVWPVALARQAVQRLQAAGEHGLDPADYGAASLAERLPQALARPDDPAAGRWAAELGQGMRLYLRHLAQGRVDPERLGQGFGAHPRAGFDPMQALASAIAQGRLEIALQAALPAQPQYAELQRVLAGLLALGDPPAWAQPLPPLPRPPEARAPRLEPGAAWDGLDLLAQRLRLLGDLPSDAPTPGRFEPPLVDALQAFQRRHGLGDDGVLGAATLAALELPPAARAAQVVLALERMRWTPPPAARGIEVNIPEYLLRAQETVDGRVREPLQMRVIVGEVGGHETPLFHSALRSIEFSPYWNVPPSIARRELVPRLRRDPAYWEREGFEFVAGDGEVERGYSAERLDAVLAGQWRIRQRPGPANALGDIKFIFPNDDSIYLHHTESVGLFERLQRDLSHGCVRVQEPVALARFAMDGMVGWDEARIRAQMAAGRSTHVALASPLPLLIAYQTVRVRDGRPLFLPDVYGLDAQLQAALDARPRPDRAR